ncbi:MAG TPA: hypothetical protein DEF68_08240 [Elusimicrobia bacterium]|nr:hypothetical protein [Elusimicrobiota bacterium]HBW23349.1 hypothetical protein [Elusimicrobiota bacterium]
MPEFRSRRRTPVFFPGNPNPERAGNPATTPDSAIVFNSGHRIEDHFADVSKMVDIGSGAERSIKPLAA